MKRKQFGIIQIILVELLKCVWLEAANVIGGMHQASRHWPWSLFFFWVFSPTESASFSLCLT